jgi:hypothetical protein
VLATGELDDVNTWTRRRRTIGTNLFDCEGDSLLSRFLLAIVPVKFSNVDQSLSYGQGISL